MKIAVSGKGGVGKTTIAGGLALHYAAQGKEVIAIDADPDANLASALGFSKEESAGITPIASLKSLIEERTGTAPGTFGGFFTLNPKVDDLPEELSLKKEKVRLMTLGIIEQGGAGCICPESALLKALVAHLYIGRNEVIVMDMEAGLEHLGRGTAKAVDALLVVVEPGQRSLQTAASVRKLAADIGLEKVVFVMNKVVSEEEEKFLLESLRGFDSLGKIGYSEKIREADRKGLSAYETDPVFRKEIENIAAALAEKIKK